MWFARWRVVFWQRFNAFAEFDLPSLWFGLGQIRHRMFDATVASVGASG
jgi:hypothetical protein